MTDADRIRNAIDAAERGTTGRVAVRLVPDAATDALARASAEFTAAEMHRHEPRNAALVLVAPKARAFSIVGDQALHERVGPAFWSDLVAQTQPYFARGALTDGIVFLVDQLGNELRRSFPRGAA